MFIELPQFPRSGIYHLIPILKGVSQGGNFHLLSNKSLSASKQPFPEDSPYRLAEAVVDKLYDVTEYDIKHNCYVIQEDLASPTRCDKHYFLVAGKKAIRLLKRMRRRIQAQIERDFSLDAFRQKLAAIQGKKPSIWRLRAMATHRVREAGKSDPAYKALVPLLKVSIPEDQIRQKPLADAFIKVLSISNGMGHSLNAKPSSIETLQRYATETGESRKIVEEKYSLAYGQELTRRVNQQASQRIVSHYRKRNRMGELTFEIHPSLPLKLTAHKAPKRSRRHK